MTSRGAALSTIAALAGAALTSCGPLHALRERTRGCIDTAAPPDGDARVVFATVPTARVRGTVRCAVVLPPGIAERDVDAVAYLLPGRGSTAEDAVRGLGLPGFLAAAMRTAARPFALAVVDAGESYFHPRVSGEDRLGLVTEDLARVVRARTGRRTLRESLMGYSMGGYGALIAAERQPLRYRAVAVAGPALFTSYAAENSSVGDAFDSRAQFAAYDAISGARRLRDVPVFVRCGSGDPFAPAVRAFAQHAPRADVAIVPGCHTDGFWRTALPQMLRFTADRLA